MAEDIRRLHSGGIILMSRINGGDRMIWRSGIPARHFLTEFNADRFVVERRDPSRAVEMVVLSPYAGLGVTPRT